MAKYLLSYSASAIRRADCVTVAQAFLECGDWQEVRRQIVEDDLLMIRSESSRKRISTELIKRMQVLNPAELRALTAVSSSVAQDAICWVSVCRTYDFISKFVTECIAERWRMGVETLTDGVYESFVSEEGVLHPELVEISEATKGKLRSQLFNMLREMEFVDKKGFLHAYMMPSECDSVISSADRRWFPTMD